MTDPRDARIAELEAQLAQARRDMAKGEQRKRVLSQVNAILDETLFEARLTNEITETAHRHLQLEGMIQSLMGMLRSFAEVPWVAVSLDLGSGRLRDFLAGEPGADAELVIAAQQACREAMRGHFASDERLGLFPLGTPERLIGTFAVPRPFGEREEGILNLFAYQMLTPIERGIFFEHMQEADRMKDEFLRMVSHELRTPLNIIKGFLYLLEQDRAQPLAPRHGEWVHEASRSVVHMGSLIADLLDYSVILAGRMAVQRNALQLARVAEKLVAQSEPLIQQHQQTLEVLVSEELPTVWADDRRVYQVLLNLVANASKHAGDGCHIVIEAFPRGRELRIEVRDDGRGILEDDAARLFRPFTALGHQRGSVAGGIGLGLVIVRGLVEAHGGAVGLQSTPGAGTTVWFTLPTTSGLVPQSPADAP